MNSIKHMDSTSPLDEHARKLLEVVQAFQIAAARPHSSAPAAVVLDCLDEALQALSASWCEIAADAAPGIVARWTGHATDEPAFTAERGLSHEQEAHLMAALHDVAAAFAVCALACREGRSTVAPLISAPAPDPLHDDVPPFASAAMS